MPMILFIIPVLTKLVGTGLLGFSGASWCVMDAPRAKVAMLYSIPAAVLGILFFLCVPFK